MANNQAHERRTGRQQPHEPTKRPALPERRPERARRGRTLLKFFCLSIFAVGAAGAAAFAYLYSHYSKIVDERIESGYLTSRAGIYAAPRVLRPGQKLGPENLAEALRRAGYVEREASNVWSGHFKIEGDAVEIWPRRADLHAGFGAADVGVFDTVRVEFDGRERIAAVKGDGTRLDSYPLEPEPLTTDPSMKAGGRAALGFKDVPPVLVRAILSIEDRRFFEHSGVDLLGVARALLSWGDADQDLKQGGSTITQQLVKNTYLSPERTLRRKINEAVISAALERRLSKEDIFALYCNEVYLGQRGGVSVRGVAQASRVFFGKELKELTLAEAATIAGMIQSPARYAPDRHAERARVRRDTVIAAMLRDGAVTEAEAQAATKEPVRTAPAESRHAAAPYFVDYVNRLAEMRYAAYSDEDERGQRVHTTIDLELQQLAEAAVRRQLDKLEKAHGGKRKPQAALVALDPQTGHVLAMVGGNSYAESQLNRATDARRQPGSVFKPIVYAAAIEAGISPISLSLDAPREFSFDRRASYRPANYGGGYSMRDVTLRSALVNSLNVVTVDLALRVGLSRVATLAERLGLPRPQAYPSLALGAAEATPLEVAAAYATFANGGRAVAPTAVARVEGRGGVYAPSVSQSAGAQVLKPSTSYLITDALSSVVNQGTARAARDEFRGMAVAGKTGTSRDGWFAGYVPNLVCVVWVGFDDGEELGMTGASSALPLWTEFVKGAVDLRPELGGESFVRPAGVVTVWMDPATGQLTSPSCPVREQVALTPALAPMGECLKHSELYDVMASMEELPFEGAPLSAAHAEPARVEVAPRVPTISAKVAPPRPIQPRAARDSAEVELPRVRPTRVEVSPRGRPMLTNELRIASQETRDTADSGWPRD